MTAGTPDSVRQKRSWVILYYVLFVVFAAIAIATWGSGHPTAVLPAAICGMMAVWASTTPIVRFFDDHVEIKVAPLAPRHKILYPEIESVERPKPGRAVLEYKAGDRLRVVKLPLSLFSAADADALVRRLESHVKG